MSSPNKRRLIAVFSGLFAGLCAAGLGAVAPGPVEGLDRLIHDEVARFSVDPSKASDRIVLVHIDDQSIDWVKREMGADWPWPREFHGVMVQTLRGWGADAVGLDLVLDQTLGHGYSDLSVFAELVGEAGGTVLGASLQRGTPAEAPTRNHGVALTRVDSREEALARAVILESLDRDAWLVNRDDGVTVWAGGFPSSEAAAGALSVSGSALLRVAPELVEGVDPAVVSDATALREHLRTRLEALSGLVPVEATPVTPETVVAERFSLGPAPDDQRLFSADVARFPVTLFLPAIAQVGVVDQGPDDDGILRRIRPVSVFDGEVYPSFPLALYLAATEGESPIAWDQKGLSLGDRRVPLDSDGLAQLRFHASRPYDPTGDGISAWRVLNDAARMMDGEDPELDPELFAGKIVIVSPSATGLLDAKPSPVDQHHLGSDINAAALDGFLQNRWVVRTGKGLEFLLTLLVAILAVLAAAGASSQAHGRGEGALGAIYALGIRSVFTVLAAGVVLVPLYAGAWQAYVRADLWVGLAAPTLGATGGVLLHYTIAELLERRDRRSIHNALGIYTSHLVADLVASGGVAALDPRRDDVSVYFSDIAGFTSFSESMEPERLAELLNVYLTEMTTEILEAEGIVDKYIGDAIMAFWGWRETQPDHAVRSVRCALKMKHRLETIRPVLQERFGVTIVARAGINSGIAVVGNMGSEQKMNVTLMGDVVNLASRLEGANKAYGTELMVGENTWELIKGEIRCRELDLMRVKGKDEPVRVFEPVSASVDVSAETSTWLGPYEAALGLYREAKFEEALSAFHGVLALRPEDGPSKVYVERCGAFIASPPGDDWDGVFVMTTK